MVILLVILDTVANTDGGGDGVVVLVHVNKPEQFLPSPSYPAAHTQKVLPVAFVVDPDPQVVQVVSPKADLKRPVAHSTKIKYALLKNNSTINEDLIGRAMCALRTILEFNT